MNETIYIHYGDDKFIPEKFSEIKNEPGWSKPIGGLWASRTDADFGWKDWCSSENFHLDSFSKSFMFTLKERSKVLEIHNKHDIDKYIINTNKYARYYLSTSLTTTLTLDTIKNNFDTTWKNYIMNTDTLKEGVDINTIPEEFLKVTKELKKTEIKKAIAEGEIIDGIEVIETPTRVKFMLSKEAKEIQSEKAGE